MKKLLLILFVCSATVAAAQEEKGMKFEHGTTWAQIKAKAKAENKYIFMDAFTTWCGPCRMMAAEIFPLQNVGEFFNANYINVKVQLDTTKKDNEEVKKWYADAHAIMKDYKVNVFPTYLFFSPDGQLVHRAVGSSDAATFIAKAKDALQADKQYYTLKKAYESGKREPEFLLSLSKAAQAAYDRDFAPIVISQYLATQKDLLTSENIKLLASSTTRISDPGFAIFRNNAEKADAVLYKGASAAIVKGIVSRELLGPFMNSKADVDWAKVETKLNENYADIKDDILYPAKANYYRKNENWPKFSQTVSEYVNKVGVKVGSGALNSYAWEIFQKCDDMACVQAALSWSKLSLESIKDPSLMDTYANLLYKSGKKEEAIKVQEEAVKLSKDPAELQATLDKMKKGEQTW
ncbi:MAG: thioredoxin fold protein [Sphingobacteriaceae bacterium]|jgi:thioredoxin-related protein|nr:thioredoxin fold protein [Sphingobacteriaceae bacterium]